MVAATFLERGEKEAAADQTTTTGLRDWLWRESLDEGERNAQRLGIGKLTVDCSLPAGPSKIFQSTVAAAEPSRHGWSGREYQQPAPQPGCGCDEWMDGGDGDTG